MAERVVLTWVGLLVALLVVAFVSSPRGIASDRKGTSAVLTVLGGSALALGSFLPWGKIGGSPIFGVPNAFIGIDDVDIAITGWFTAIAGLALLSIGLVSLSGRTVPGWLGWATLVVGAGSAVIDYLELSRTEVVGFTTSTTPRIGIGMQMMLAGSVLALVGLAMGAMRKVAPTPPLAPPRSRD